MARHRPASRRFRERLRRGGLLALFAVTVFAGPPGLAGDRRPLWPGGAPLEKPITDTEDNPARPTLDRYPASRWPNGTAVIICPGGSYGHLALAQEGQPAAAWLNELSVAAFLLRYRHGPDYSHPVPLLDVQRAVRHVRFHAREYGIDPSRIGIMGFSAGGHLAATAATHFDGGDPVAADPVDRVSSRPDFAILCYPVISFVEPFTHARSRRNFFGTDAPPGELVRQFSNELQATPQTPPTFLFLTDEDTVVPAENSIAFYLALRKAGVPAELHVYRHGRHGGGLWTGDPLTGAWPRQLARWLQGQGWLNGSAPKTANPPPAS